MKKKSNIHLKVTFNTVFILLCAVVLYKSAVLFPFLTGNTDVYSGMEMNFIILMLIPAVICTIFTAFVSVRRIHFYSPFSLIMLAVFCILSLLEFIESVFTVMMVFSSISAQILVAALILDIVRAVRGK